MVFKIDAPNGVCVYMGLLLVVVLKKYHYLKKVRRVSTVNQSQTKCVEHIREKFKIDKSYKVPFH